MAIPTVPVVQALAAVMAEVQAVGKEGHNSSQNYAFRGIDGVMNAVGPALRNHRVVIVPTVEETNYRDVEVGKNRTLMREVTVRVRYTVHGPGGDTLEGVVCGESMDSGDKGTAKAFSVAYRTFLLQALTIPTHQPDPDEHSYERSEAVADDPAAPGLRSSVQAAIEQLSDAEKAELKGFFAAEALPPVRVMNAEQCGLVITHLLRPVGLVDAGVGDDLDAPPCVDTSTSPEPSEVQS